MLYQTGHFENGDLKRLTKEKNCVEKEQPHKVLPLHLLLPQFQPHPQHRHNLSSSHCEYVRALVQ